MASTLLQVLKEAELEQYYDNFSKQGITQLDTLAQVVQDLRLERPTMESGLVSAAALKHYGQQPQHRASVTGSGLPDIRKLSVSRRAADGNPPLASTAHSNIPLVPQSRTRSRTLPDQYQQPLFLRSKPSQGTLKLSPPDTRLMGGDESDSDAEEKLEVRRGSLRLLDTYGVPIQGKRPGALGAGGQSLSPNASPVRASATLASTGPHAGSVPSDLYQKIRVCVRKRPLNKAELTRGDKDITPSVGLRSILVNETKFKVDLTKYIEQHHFTFDDVFDSDAANDQIYARTAQPLVKYMFDGGKATCFAYGQTGSGKTYTMLDPEHGLYTLAAKDVFQLLKQPQYEHMSAWVGFYEIYQGQLYDLLNNRKKLFAREDGRNNVVIAGIREFVIRNTDDLMKVFEYGNQCRSTGSTNANSDSSRSHAVLQILLKPTNNRKKVIGKLSFIDLAGSERGADRGETDMKTRMEGAEINKSLLALKECIRALDQDRKHTPFRQSKLTQVLKDSFAGKSRTCMIATVSPNQNNSEHTLNTLRYADRVKELKGERNSRDREPREGEHGADDMLNGEDALDIDDDLGAELDGLDQYQDNLLLDDEDFPSDGDGDILDGDFPHEDTTESDNNRWAHQPIQTSTPRTGSVPSLQSHKENLMSTRFSLPSRQVYSSTPHSYSTVSLQPRVQPSSALADTTDDLPQFDPQAIQDFIHRHRIQIRQINECSREESTLLTVFSDILQRRRQQQDALPPNTASQAVPMSVDFIYYLEGLENILSRKMNSIGELRERIRDILQEDIL